MQKVKGVSAIILSGILFALIGVITKLIGTDIPSGTLAFLRMIIGLGTLAVIVPFLDHNIFKVTKRELFHYAIIGFLLAITVVLYLTAFLFAPISNILLLGSVYMVLTFIIATIFLNEKATRFEWAMIGLSVVGLAIINPFQGEYIFGNILALIGASIYAVLIVLMRKEDKIHTISNSIWFLFFATVFLIPLPLIQGWGNTVSHLPLVLVLGIFSTGLAYLFLTYGLEKLCAGECSFFHEVSSILAGITLGVLIIGEVLTPNIVIGGIILLGSAVAIEYKIGMQKCKTN